MVSGIFGSNTYLHPIRILLEQSKFDDLHHHSLKYVMGPMLFVGVVLCNAYRHDGMLNLVLPSKPIYYENVRDLRNNNYSLYFRAMFVSYAPGSYEGVYEAFKEPIETSRIQRFPLHPAILKRALNPWINPIWESEARELEKNQDKLLFEALDACNDTAVVLPTYQCQNWSDRLQGRGHVGK